MKSSRHLLSLVVLLSLGCAHALAQSPGKDTKRFSQDGVSFSYPARWSLSDSSDQQVQKVFLESGNSDAIILLLVHHDRVLAENWKQTVENVALSYVGSILTQYEESGTKPKVSQVKSKIGNTVAQGMIIRGTLYQEPRTDEIYWALINERLVMLMLGTPDDDRRKAASAWYTVRSSLKFAGQKPAAKPGRVFN